MNNNEATVKVFRFDPAVDKEPRFQTFIIPAEGWQNRKVIDVIRYIYENFEPGLAFREPCGLQRCGACTVLVNSKPVLACDALAVQEMTIEPVKKYKILKDLVVDLAWKK